MAAWEDIPGFPTHPAGVDYWRRQADRHSASTRQLRLLFQLSEQVDLDMNGFCRRMTQGRADHPGRLSPRDAHVVIEALKKMVDRGYRPVASGQCPVASAQSVGAASAAVPVPDDDVPF
jgi:hypothetical protein